MMVYSLLRVNPWQFQTPSSFVVITSSLPFWINLVLYWNIERWRLSISPGLKVSWIPHLSTYWTLADQFWSPKTLGSILVSSLIENFHSINTSTSIPTKWSWLSSVWGSLETPPEASSPFRNIFFTEAASSPLPSMIINYDFIIGPHYHTHLESLTKCNKELPSGSLACSKPLLYLELKPL